MKCFNGGRKRIKVWEPLHRLSSLLNIELFNLRAGYEDGLLSTRSFVPKAIASCYYQTYITSCSVFY
jgi:hypothetical protein